jgi:division protein CdvB (Snf7/Vps24/ESCRT-III family)
MANAFIQDILDRLAKLEADSAQDIPNRLTKLEAEIADINRGIKAISSEVAGTTTRSEVALSIATLNEYIHTLNSAIRLAKRCGLPDDFAKYATEIQQIIRLINQLKIAYQLLTAAEVAAGNPLAIAQLGITVGSAIVTATDIGS